MNDDVLTFGEVFAGVSGFGLGFERAGMRCQWQVEINRYRQGILSRRFPGVGQWDYIRTFPPAPPEDWAVDVIVGGFPCQDISVGGEGKGLEGETSQRSLFGGLIEFSEGFPRAGFMRNGIVYRRQPLVPITRETGFSLWPTTRESMGDHMICWKLAESGEHRCNLEDFLAWQWLLNGGTRRKGLDVNPNWLDWYAGFPVRWTDSQH